MNKTLKKIALIIVLVILISSFQTVAKATSSEPKVYSEGESTLELSGEFSVNGCDGAIYVHSGAKLTITGNGSVHGEVCPDDGYAMAVFAKGAGTEVTIEGGTYTNGKDDFSTDQDHVDLIYVKDGAKVYVKGGTFKCTTPGWTLNSSNTSLGEIIVSGGRFYKFNPATANTEAGFGDGNGVTGGLPNTEVRVVDGCEVIQDGEWYIVCAHTDVNHNVQEDPTYLANGTAEHWVCNDCSTIFLDEAKTVKGTEADLVLPKLVNVSSGNANVSTEAIDSAISDADTTSSETVLIPLSSLGTEVSAATLPVSSLEMIAAADKDLTLATTETTITIDSKALESITNQTEGSATIKVDISKIEENKLNEDQKTALKEKNVSKVFSAKIFANEKVISNFGGGKIKLELPFTIENGKNASDYKFVHIADDGVITEVPAKFENNKVVVELEHFSEYAIVSNKTVEKTEGNSSNSGSTQSTPAPAEPAKDVTPKTGNLDMSLIIISVIGIVALAGVVVIKKYNK